MDREPEGVRFYLSDGTKTVSILATHEALGGALLAGPDAVRDWVAVPAADQAAAEVRPEMLLALNARKASADTCRGPDPMPTVGLPDALGRRLEHRT